MEGTVKWYNGSKGYGFIAPQDGSSDVFLHASALESAGIRTIDEGQKVSYEVASNRGKTSAAHLKLID